MGRPMSARLLAADFPLMVWNRSPAKCAALAPLGARIASSVTEAVAYTDVLMLCLADTAAVDAVVFGPDGIAVVPGEAWDAGDFRDAQRFQVIG